MLSRTQNLTPSWARRIHSPTSYHIFLRSCTLCLGPYISPFRYYDRIVRKLHCVWTTLSFTFNIFLCFFVKEIFKAEALCWYVSTMKYICILTDMNVVIFSPALAPLGNSSSFVGVTPGWGMTLTAKFTCSSYFLHFRSKYPHHCSLNMHCLTLF